MAQQDDGSGRAPVVIVRPTTSVTSGIAVTQKLVGAAVAFGDILRRTYGPNGLDKMMYKTNGENAITPTMVQRLFLNSSSNIRLQRHLFNLQNLKKMLAGMVLRDVFCLQVN